MSALQPIEGCGECKNAHEAGGGLPVSGGDGAPLIEPGPEALDLIAVVVDPVRAGDGRLVALRRDRGSRAHIPDVLTKGVAGVATAPDDPLGHARKLVEQRNRMGQFMGLTGRQPEGDGTSLPVGDHTSLGTIAATRPSTGSG